MVFCLPLRQTEGFLRSLFELLHLDLPTPDHTILSRRLQKLGPLQLRRLGANEPIHLLIDSTGLRIHVGHLRKPPKRRVWRKLHLAYDAGSVYEAIQGKGGFALTPGRCNNASSTPHATSPAL